MTVNHFFGIGRLTKDPDCQALQNQTTVAKFDLAINEGYGQKKETTFIPVVCWNKLAESVSQNLQKGSKVHVEGRFKQERWQNEKGQHSRLVLIARAIEFLDSPPK